MIRGFSGWRFLLSFGLVDRKKLALDSEVSLFIKCLLSIGVIVCFGQTDALILKATRKGSIPHPYESTAAVHPTRNTIRLFLPCRLNSPHTNFDKNLLNYNKLLISCKENTSRKKAEI